MTTAPLPPALQTAEPADVARPAFPPCSALVDDVRPSPNHGERRGRHGDGVGPDMVILHYTGMPAGRGMSACERATRWLTTEASQVSCHYVVDEDGRILQLVPEARRAWHAGVSSWKGETDLNSASIGIEIVNPGHVWDMSAAPDLPPGETPAKHPGYSDFPEPQVAAVIALLKDIVARNHLSQHAILAHSDIAPMRKTDPGEKFPWERLAAAGLGLWTPPAPLDEATGLQFGNEGQPIAAIQSMFGALGYGVNVSGVFDETTRAVVTAFQRHWRPQRVDGIADRSTMTTLYHLLQQVAATPAIRPEGR